ncbi:MAG: N-acetylglucosamine-6-phosphate deacetylase [Rhodospirillaceae bacterium]|nr:N-acetylglucosamine-6-phosphate deacetylase [Rhodospirillaceae bacterium]|tara:strand:- start:671 stop:1765 length:1095 start_codon:yes stop_codon:yes gene_type:complete
MTKISGKILTPTGWVYGCIEFDNKIFKVTPGEVTKDALIILPGFVDLHVPGGGGGDVMDGYDAIRRCATLHAKHGTTSFLATTVTAPNENIIKAVKAIQEVSVDRYLSEARVLGVHLEGPYINPNRLGAQPPFAQKPDIDFISRLCKYARLRLVTLAPECDPQNLLLKYLTKKNIVVQIGHSAADYQEVIQALDDGARGFTHLYNAMSPLNHRKPGVVGAALAHGDYAAIIPDLVHVAPGAILAAFRALPHLYFVTDATAAAGMPDGQYSLGGQIINKSGDSVFLDDQTLAGSALTMDQALRNLVSIGMDLADAALRLSTIPADLIGEFERGRIEENAFADFVVLEKNLEVVKVFVEGKCVSES